MFTRKILEYVKKECPDVVALYKHFNKRTGLNYSFDRFIDDYYVLKEKYPDVFEQYCIDSVYMEDMMNQITHESQEVGDYDISNF